MDNKSIKAGFLNLAKKTLAIFTSSLASLSPHDSKATAPAEKPVAGNGSEFEERFKRSYKPKLILKLNMANPADSYTSMHTSHSSHSSHSSHYSSGGSGGGTYHSSHSSHSSHYSSTPSYSPSVPSYRPTPIPKVKTYIPKRSSPSTSYPGTSYPSTTYPSTTYPSTTYPSSTGVPYKAPSPLVSPKPELIIAGTDIYLGDESTIPTIALGSRILYKGCLGTDVKELQKLLAKAGYILPVTGYFGDKTYAAVVQFQNSHELMPDGKVGPITLTQLKSGQ